MCGGFVEQVEKSVVQPVSNVLAEADKSVGYKLPHIAAAIALPQLAPELLGAEAAFTGATETGLATLPGEGILADTVGTTLLSGAPEVVTATETIGQALPYTEAYDAYNLAQQGLSSSQIGTTLSTTGVDPTVAQYMGELATQGLSPEQIAQEIANLQPTSAAQANAQDIMEQARSTNVPVGSPTSVYTGEKPLISPMQALQGIRMASGLLGGGQQQQPQIPQMQTGGRMQTPQGSVDYSGLYNLLATQRPRNPNSLLG